jgi:lipid-binding SYLF domain-containing protein
MRSVIVSVVAGLVYCISLSAAVAKDDAEKSGTASKVKDKEAKISAKAKTEAVRISDAPKLIGNASRVVKEIDAIPKRKIPPVLINSASAIVVVPGAVKRDFMAGDGISGGVLLVRDTEGKWNGPVFITLSGGTLGWQIVSSPMDIVLVFKNRKSVDAILKGKYIMDGKSAIGPGRLGLDMKGATPRELKMEIVSYVRSKGAFEEAAVGGTTLQIDAAANDAFYAKPKVDAADILSGKLVKTSEDVKALQKLLAGYGAGK